MAKTNNHSKLEKIAPRKVAWSESILLEGEAHCMFPGNSVEDDDKRWTYAFLTWLDKEQEAFTIQKFCRLHRIRRQNFEKKLKSSNYPILRSWWDEIQRCLADNRYNGALQKRLDGEKAMLGIWKLDADFKEDLEFAAELKKKSDPLVDANKSGTYTLIVKDEGYQKTKDDDDKSV